MNKSKKKQRKIFTRIVLLTLLFILLALIGAIPVWIVFHMDQILTIRIIEGVSGPLWAIITIIIIASRSEYFKLWRRWRHEREANMMAETRSIYPEYQKLYEKYPLAISRYEQHWRHHKDETDAPTLDELISAALLIDEEEWGRREEFRKQARQERRSTQAHTSDSLAPSRN